MTRRNRARAPVDVGLHGAGRHAERSPDLLLAEVSDVAQDDGLSLAARQGGSASTSAIRSTDASTCEVDASTTEKTPGVSLHAGSPNGVDSEVRRDPHHPPADAITGTEPGPAGPRTSEGLCSKVLGHCPIVDDPRGNLSA